VRARAREREERTQRENGVTVVCLNPLSTTKIIDRLCALNLLVRVCVCVRESTSERKGGRMCKRKSEQAREGEYL